MFSSIFPVNFENFDIKINDLQKKIKFKQIKECFATALWRDNCYWKYINLSFK